MCAVRAVRVSNFRARLDRERGRLDLVIRDRVGTQGRQTQTARGPRPTRGVAVGATPPVHLPDRPARCE